MHTHQTLISIINVCFASITPELKHMYVCGRNDITIIQIFIHNSPFLFSKMTNMLCSRYMV